MQNTRLTSALLVLVSLGLAAASVHADVKTRQRTQVKFEGMLGRIAGLAGGGAAADGINASVAVKGTRKAELNDRTGRIVDLSEEKVYDLDVRKKEYRVMTFAELREQWKKAKADAEKQAKDMPTEERQEAGQAGKEVEITVDVKETGATKSIAGHQAKQVVVTLTAFEKGKTLEEGGGMVVTNDVWVAPRVAALDEIAQFDLKFIKAVYGEDFTAAAQSMAAALAMYPGLQDMLKRMEERMRALDGTTMATTMKVETVKSAAAAKDTSAPPTRGLGGALARRLGAGRASEPRSLLVTSTVETQSIDASAADADVAIPTGFKEKK
jgi:hypothetical protein